MRFGVKRRLLYVAFGAATFLTAYSIGAAVPLSDEEAREIREQFAEQIEGIDDVGIFLNNLRISLIMFIPAVGAGFGGFAGFATGAVFTALAQGNPLLGSVPPLIILITPFGIMEVFVYGLAMSRSGLLILRLVKDKPWHAGNGRPFYENTVIPTLIELGIAAAILFAAAIIEW
ncbi:MAG: stage II sporulation protein M, partial [Nitrososphaera sp.]|nr:stage II sporulation protein M [Nitrososphaera sp.]